MNVTKTILVAAALVFGLNTLATAAPRSAMANNSATTASQTDIPGKAQQDHFAVSN